jgi:hypothetical protein
MNVQSQRPQPPRETLETYPKRRNEKDKNPLTESALPHQSKRQCRGSSVAKETMCSVVSKEGLNRSSSHQSFLQSLQSVEIRSGLSPSSDACLAPPIIVDDGLFESEVRNVHCGPTAQGTSTLALHTEEFSTFVERFGVGSSSLRNSSAVAVAAYLSTAYSNRRDRP